MKIALIYLGIGLLCGAIIGIGNHIVVSFKNNLVVRIILDIITTFAVSVVFVYLNHLFFYGEIRLHLLAFFLLGMYIERKTLGKLFAKLFLMLYNWVSMGYIKFKNTTLGKFITK